MLFTSGSYDPPPLVDAASVFAQDLATQSLGLFLAERADELTFDHQAVEMAQYEVGFTNFAGFFGAEHEATLNCENEYLVPNEQYPILAKPILEKAPPGMVVSVGSERALFNGILNPQATHVVGVDNHSETILFHTINELLLRITSFDQDLNYRKLRCQPYQAEWKVAAMTAFRHNIITYQELCLLCDENVFSWWAERVAYESQWQDLYQGPERAIGRFQGVNYLFEDAATKRAHELSQERRYLSAQVDLANSQDVALLAHNLSRVGSPISVLDLSNVWEDEFPNNYLGPQKTGALLEALDGLMHEQGIVIMTCGKRRNGQLYIVYHGHRIANIREIGGTEILGHDRTQGFADAIQRMQTMIYHDRQQPRFWENSRLIKSALDYPNP